MTALRVLAVASDAATLGTIERAVASEGDQLFTAMDVAEALAIASAERPEVAFVDVGLEEKAGLALVHHLSVVASPLAIYALAPASAAELGAEALSLGAAGLIVTPASGDALLRAIGETRLRLAEQAERTRLHAELEAARRHDAWVERLAKVVRLGAQVERAKAASIIAETLSEASGALGAAVYAVEGTTAHAWQTLAATGTLAALEQGEVSEGSGRRIIPLEAGERILGHVVLDAPRADAELGALTELAAAIASRFQEPEAKAADGDHGRVYGILHFEDAAAREIEKAKRHGRRLAVAAIIVEDDAQRRAAAALEIVVAAVRDSDVVAQGHEGEFLLLLPETSALGAHACRRRVLVRAEGDRRAKPSEADRRGPVAGRPSRGLPLSIGVATFPHDGKTFSRLLERARRRAEDARRSAVHSLALASKPLRDIIDTLLARPMLDAGRCSPFPLDLALPSALALVANACREAGRGGEATILATTQSGVGLVSAARSALPVDGAAVTLHEVDVASVEGCADAEAVVVVAEHGTWTLCGRTDGSRFRGVHCADPLIADLVAQRLARAGGVRLG
jgi:ActR/RegA family two-component response regulator